MPYKDPKKQRKAVKIASRKHRAKKKRQKQQARKELLGILPEPKIEVRLPTIHKMFFGPQKKWRIAGERVKKKPKTKPKTRRRR